MSIVRDPDPNNPRNWNPLKPVTWIRLGGVIIVIIGGITIWQLNHGPDVPSSPTSSPAAAAPAPASSDSGVYTVTFDGSGTFAHTFTDPNNDEHWKASLDWHIVFENAPASGSADMNASTVTGTGHFDDSATGTNCDTSKWRFEPQPILISAPAPAGTGIFAIPIPAVVDNTYGPNSTNVCAAYEITIPPGDQAWFYAEFPMQIGIHDVSGKKLTFTDNQGDWNESWSGTVTVAAQP